VGEFDRDNLVEALFLLVEEGLRYLLEPAVDRADHRHPVDQILAGADGATDQPFGQPADDDGGDQKARTPTPRTGNSYSGPNQRPIRMSG
jgi:hypothetical protein